MAADKVIGPRGGADTKDGAYQRTAFGTAAGIVGIDLAAFAGQYVTIAWAPAVPAADGAKLWYVFVDPTDASQTIADDGESTINTTPTPDVLSTKVAYSPEWIDGNGGERPRIVPEPRTRLLIEATGTGRVRVGVSE